MAYVVSNEAENAATGEMVEKPQASKPHLAVLEQRVKEIGQTLATLGRILESFHGYVFSAGFVPPYTSRRLQAYEALRQLNA